MMPTPFAPERRPLELDVRDDGEVRRWLARIVSEQVVTRGAPLPSIHLLFDGHEEVLEWPSVLQVDPGADLASTWQALAQRRDVERRVLVVGLQREDGALEACMFEDVREDGAPLTWWVGRRPYVVEAGLGRLLDTAWHQHGGQGRGPEPFASLLTPAVGTRPALLLPARALEPRVWMQTEELPPEVPPPTTAMELSELTQAVVVDALQTEGFKHLIVFVMRGRTWEKWLLGEGLPTDADDMVRWIAARLGDADGVATAEGVIAQVNGASERVIRIVAELGGYRAERAIILAPKPGKPDDMVPARSMVRELGRVAEEEGWIGVDPLLGGELIATVLGMGKP